MPEQIRPWTEDLEYLQFAKSHCMPPLLSVSKICDLPRAQIATFKSSMTVANVTAVATFD